MQKFYLFFILAEEASPTAERRGSEKKKRVKMADLRAFVETKMFSKSEKNLEKVGFDTISANGKTSLQHAVRFKRYKISMSFLLVLRPFPYNTLNVFYLLILLKMHFKTNI